MKGSKEISAGGRKTLSVAIIADGNLPGARAICTSYCLATGTQILKITNKGSSHSFLSCSSSKSRELPRIVPLMTWLEVRFESSMKSCSRPGWLLQQICESQISFVLTSLFLLCLQGSHCAVAAYYSSHGQLYLLVSIAKRNTVLPWWGYPSTLCQDAVPRRKQLLWSGAQEIIAEGAAPQWPHHQHSLVRNVLSAHTFGEITYLGKY